MRSPSKLMTYVAGASTLTLLLATSAFADSRHRDGTSHTDQHSTGSHENGGGHPRGDSRGDVSRSQRAPIADHNFGNRGTDRNFGNRGTERSYDRGSDRNFTRETNVSRGVVRNDSRSFDNRSFDNRSFARGEDRNFGGSFRGSRETFRDGVRGNDGRVSFAGRISRFEHERGGYRIWVGGSSFPYWVPESYFFGRRIGIGLDLRLGGVFRDGAVYVDALGWPGDPYYADPYYYSPGSYVGSASIRATDGELVQGVVDGVDYRAGLLYVRDAASQRVVTVDMRRIDRNYGRVSFDDLRPGDRITLTGAWVGDGQFAAARIENTGY